MGNGHCRNAALSSTSVEPGYPEVIQFCRRPHTGERYLSRGHSETEYNFDTTLTQQCSWQFDLLDLNMVTHFLHTRQPTKETLNDSAVLGVRCGPLMWRAVRTAAVWSRAKLATPSAIKHARSSAQRLQRVVEHVVNHDALCVRVEARQDGGL